MEYLRESEREREMASLNTSLSSTFNLIYHQRHQRGNNKYYITVSRTTASTASFLVVEHKGKHPITHGLPNPVGNHKNIFSVINIANSLQLLWLHLQSFLSNSTEGIIILALV